MDTTLPFPANDWVYVLYGTHSKIREVLSGQQAQGKTFSTSAISLDYENVSWRCHVLTPKLERFLKRARSLEQKIALSSFKSAPKKWRFFLDRKMLLIMPISHESALYNGRNSDLTRHFIVHLVEKLFWGAANADPVAGL